MGKDRERGIGLREKVYGLAMIAAGVAGIRVGLEVNRARERALDNHPLNSELRILQWKHVKREAEVVLYPNSPDALAGKAWIREEIQTVEDIINEDITDSNRAYFIGKGQIVPFIAATLAIAGIYKLVKQGRKRE